jgi:hypothetical protein
MDHYFEHQKKIQEDFEDVMHMRDLVNQKWISFISELSTDTILDLIKQVYEFSLKSDEINKTTDLIQQQLKKLINDDQQNFIKQSIRITEFDQDDYLENDVDRLKQDIKELELKLEEINNDNQKQTSNIELETTKTSSWKKKYPARLIVSTLKNHMMNKVDSTPTLSHLLFKQTSPSILDLKDNEFVFVESENETHPEDDAEDDDDEMIVFVDSDTASKITHKVHFSNNIVRYLRGPFKAIVHGTMHAVDVCAQGTHISDTALQAVNKGLEKQTTNNSNQSTFADINSEWTFEGENADRGYSSPSIWMRDSQNRRVLIKIQEHPLCAANEWLAYVLGRFLGLPVNEVQIGIYENNLVTIHTDVACDDEKTVTFMDLPKRKRKALMTDPIMERMDIFDRIIQNVDRNQQNVLITMPKTTDINDDSAKVKIHLIDHSNCFGMGKLNGISLIAAKFHSNHLAVVKFDPIHKSKQFEQYLNKLPVNDRPLIGKTLNRFASIANDKFDSWINEIQDLLSSSQYNRINGVLRRQRDIAKRYATQWGISPRSSNIKSNETKENTSEIVSYL